MGGKITFEVLTDISSLKQIWREFDSTAFDMIASGRLPRLNYSFYQTYVWNEFVERYYAGMASVRYGLKRIEYILVRQDGEPVAILPLMVSKFGGKVEMTSWRTSGINNVVSPFNDEKHSDVFSALVSFMRERYKGKKLRLFELPPSTPFTRALKAIPGARYSERGSYHIPLSEFEDFDSYYGSLNKKLRHNIKTRSNHFTHGDLTCELKVYTRHNPPSTEYWEKIWRLFFKRKNVWRKREVTIFRRFMCAVETRRECAGGMKTMSFNELDETILFVFEINGEPSAFAFLYMSNGYIVVPKLAIDTEQRAHAPGILMLKEIMRWCYDRGVKDFDLCRGEEPYKQQMGAVNEPVSRIVAKL
ncbi:MAG: GNAT family N-acetyltransferase [Bacteroides sp.]|nr:GNAT family N-acetyltransferase [Bacteroides sp.]